MTFPENNPRPETADDSDIRSILQASLHAGEALCDPDAHTPGDNRDSLGYEIYHS
jgi:hypothetical protein